MNHNHFPTTTPETTAPETPETPALETPQSETPAPTESQKPETPQSETAHIPDLPTTNPDHTCAFYLREIDRLGRMPDVKNFLMDTADRDFHEFTDPVDLDAFGDAYAEFIDPFLTPDDKSALKRYSGFDYKVINQVARGIWSYDLLGRKTPEAVASAERSIANLSAAIERAPSPGVDLISYRGTNLDSFQAYGINSLSDLKSLEGQFFLETGFTSTSLSPDHSFADKDFDDPLRRPCNISITCRIPKEARETIALTSHEVAYNPEQSELLIDKDSLFYISSADLSPDRSSARLEMTLLPRDLYDQAPEASTE